MSKRNFTGMQRLYHQGDQIMIGVNWFLLVLSLALASWYQTWGEFVAIGIPAAAVPTLLYLFLPTARITRVAMAISFMIFAALHIHQAHGMLEMHFSIFVLLAFLLFYRDWLPILMAAGVIAVHHLAFNFMQEAGYGVYVFDNRTGFTIVLIHAAFVVFETALLLYMALLLNREAQQAVELNEIGGHMTIVDGRIDLRYRKENAKSMFANDFNQFIGQIYSAVSSAQGAAGNLTRVSTEMVSQSRHASERVQRQKMETDQVATAINEMTATVMEVARNATEAAHAAQQADDESVAGHKIVDQTIAAIGTLAKRVEHAATVIERLNENSDEIGTVLGVIKAIADQTNLLALNAAIEAARAGEQGRGFAVVADEVRTLASRTQKSTEEIHAMIDKLQAGVQDAVQVMSEGREQAQQGVEQASKTGEALESITRAVATITNMNTQIAAAAEEQSKVAEEINRNIVNITVLAEETSEGINQAASSSQGLESAAEELRNQVQMFWT